MFLFFGVVSVSQPCQGVFIAFQCPLEIVSIVVCMTCSVSVFGYGMGICNFSKCCPHGPLQLILKCVRLNFFQIKIDKTTLSKPQHTQPAVNSILTSKLALTWIPSLFILTFQVVLFKSAICKPLFLKFIFLSALFFPSHLLCCLTSHSHMNSKSSPSLCFAYIYICPLLCLHQSSFPPPTSCPNLLSAHTQAEGLTEATGLACAASCLQ